MAYFRRKGDKNKYSFTDVQCIGRECWAAGMFQHRSPMSGGGSRNTGSPDTPCCLNRAYRGCPDGPVGRKEITEYEEMEGRQVPRLVTIAGLPEVSKELAAKRKAEGWKRV